MTPEERLALMLGRTDEAVEQQKLAYALDQLSMEELGELYLFELSKEAAGRKKMMRAKFERAQQAAKAQPFIQAGEAVPTEIYDKMDAAKKVTPISNKASRGEAPIPEKKPIKMEQRNELKAGMHEPAPKPAPAPAPVVRAQKPAPAKAAEKPKKVPKAERATPKVTVPQAPKAAPAAAKPGGVRALIEGAKRHATKRNAGILAGVGALGAGAALYDHHKKKAASADLSFEDMVELADQWGRELAYGDLEKISAPVGSLVGRGLNTMMGATHAGRAAVGAGVGAAGGAANYAMKSPEERRNSSLLGNMAGGAAIGAGAGAASGHAVQALGGMNNRVGAGIRNAMTRDLVARPSTNFRAAQSVMDMRGASRANLPKPAANNIPKAPTPPAGASAPAAPRPEVQQAAANMPKKPKQQPKVPGAKTDAKTDQAALKERLKANKAQRSAAA